MSEFGTYGASDEEYAAIRTLSNEVDADPDDFKKWEALIEAAEKLDGGLNRNSSPQALALFRESYDRFLAKFPLLFGYWKKYADMEFTIAGTESAEMVYERGCAAIVKSVDLWTAFCSFKMDTTHDPSAVRDLFERAATNIGLDYYSHPFWNKYIEYEERQESEDRIFDIHLRILRMPIHQMARYFERFRVLCQSRPPAKVVTTDVLTRFQAEVQAEHVAAHGDVARPELEIERDIRAKIDAMYYEVLQATNTEVQKRWPFESKIERPYFHVNELEYGQLENWRAYLDFEEAEGTFDSIVNLYERGLVTCALYDDLWFRYARWMAAQPKKHEEVRNIYIRACTLFVPISRPGIRLQWAYFEEAHGRIDVAVDIHQAILMKLPDCIEVIVSWANLVRRQKGVEDAAQVYKDLIEAPTVDIFTKAALVAESALLLWKGQGAVKEARAVFLKNVQWYADSRFFWEKWFEFEMGQPTFGKEASEQVSQSVRHVYDELRNRSRISAITKRELCQPYLRYLANCGDKNSMKTFLEVDRDMFGPASVTGALKSSNDVKGNGVTSEIELDEASKIKAEAVLLRFHEIHPDPKTAGQGPVDFN